MNTVNLFTLCLLFIAVSCRNDDNGGKNPADNLPPATQTGEQTFGCLIDGEIFLPDTFGSGRANAFYQLIDGKYTLGISANNSNGELISVGIGGLEINNLNEGTYQLVSEQSGNFYGKYLIGGGIDYRGVTDDNKPGVLVITNFNPDNFIVSGNFEFTAVDTVGNEVQITVGRFDVKYTN